MRLQKRRRGTLAVMDMTPMIDIVFLLLIFFMMITQVTEANREELELPTLQGQQEQTATTLIVNVMSDGQIVMEGRTISQVDLAAILAREIDARGGEPGDIRVVIRADQVLEARPVNQIIETLNRLGIDQANFSVIVPQ